MFQKQTISDISIDKKQVLLRADYNVALDSDGKITSDYRIKKSLPTLQHLVSKGCRVVIISHLGRPKSAADKQFSLRPVAQRLSKLLNQDITFVGDCTGSVVRKATEKMKPGSVVLLENLRFYAEEKTNDIDFAKKLASDSGADIFVQDAFGVAHRKHASTSAITKELPSVAGLLLESEYQSIQKAVGSPKRPMMAIVGGAKISDKLGMIEQFISSADYLVVGGAMANTFLKSQGIEVGESLYDKEELDTAQDIIDRAIAERKKRKFVFYIPQDAVAAEKIAPDAELRIVDWDTHSVADIESYPERPKRSSYSVHKHEKILDIGPFSSAFIVGLIQSCETVVWNGTMGVTEVPPLSGAVGPFGHGSEAIMHALAGRYGQKPYSLIGGGDTVGFVQSKNAVDLFDHVSTGGGASLALMSGDSLPAVEALLDENQKNKPQKGDK